MRRMQLFYSHASPYARKCRMAAIVNGLAGEIELLLTDPINDSDYRRTNPLGKVPALVTRDGLTLFDSPLICEYLDSIAIAEGRPGVLQHQHADYFQRQLAHVCANGIMDAAVATIMEKRRQTEHSELWLTRWNESINAAVKVLDLRYLGGYDAVNIATIAVAAALGYLDLRLPEQGWREHNRALATWFASIQTADWYRATAVPTV